MNFFVTSDGVVHQWQTKVANYAVALTTAVIVAGCGDAATPTAAPASPTPTVATTSAEDGSLWWTARDGVELSERIRNDEVSRDDAKAKAKVLADEAERLRAMFEYQDAHPKLHNLANEAQNALNDLAQSGDKESAEETHKTLTWVIEEIRTELP